METDECFIAADDWLVVVYFEPFGRQVATGVFAFESDAREALDFLRTTEPSIRSIGRWSVVKAKASLAKRTLACQDIVCLSACGAFVFTKQPVYFPPKSGFYAEYEVHRAPGFDELAVATYKLSLAAEELFGEEPTTESEEDRKDDATPPSAKPASMTSPKADEARPSTGIHPPKSNDPAANSTERRAAPPSAKGVNPVADALGPVRDALSRAIQKARGLARATEQLEEQYAATEGQFNSGYFYAECTDITGRELDPKWTDHAPTRERWFRRKAIDAALELRAAVDAAIESVAGIASYMDSSHESIDRRWTTRTVGLLRILRGAITRGHPPEYFVSALPMIRTGVPRALEEGSAEVERRMEEVKSAMMASVSPASARREAKADSGKADTLPTPDSKAREPWRSPSERPSAPLTVEEMRSSVDALWAFINSGVERVGNSGSPKRDLLEEVLETLAEVRRAFANMPEDEARTLCEDFWHLLDTPLQYEVADCIIGLGCDPLPWTRFIAHPTRERCNDAYATCEAASAVALHRLNAASTKGNHGSDQAPEPKPQADTSGPRLSGGDAYERSGLDTETIRAAAKRLGWDIVHRGRKNYYLVADLKHYWPNKNFDPPTNTSKK
jgi:hypothetical protein